MCLYTSVFRSENIVHLVLFLFVRWLHFIRTWWFQGTLDWSEFTLLHELSCTIATDRRAHSILSLSFSFQLLSNDNGFLNWGPPSFFDQRTLTARFQMNLTKYGVRLRGQVLHPCMLEPIVLGECAAALLHPWASNYPRQVLVRLVAFTAGSIWVETWICCQSHA